MLKVNKDIWKCRFNTATRYNSVGCRFTRLQTAFWTMALVLAHELRVTESESQFGSDHVISEVKPPSQLCMITVGESKKVVSIERSF